MNRMFYRAVRAVLTSAALLCCVHTPARSAGPETVIPPFAYWDILAGPDLNGWSINYIHPAGTWREQFPSAGTLHEQSRFVDSDGSGTITRGDEIEATGLGPGVWHVEWVTTEFTFERHPLVEGPPTLVVASDKYYWGCSRQSHHCDDPPCEGPQWPAWGDSFFVLSPEFNQIVIVAGWWTAGYGLRCQVWTGDWARLIGPMIPDPPDPGDNYALTDIRCGVWLSWDQTTATRRQSWGWLKGTYHR